jgi:hypothetical protein
MKARGFALGLAVLLCALPLAAQDIPPGDDIWDSLGGGATDTTLSSADWFALCGASVPDTAVQLKGFNVPGYGTGDTAVTRLDYASLQNDGDTATVRIRLKELSFVNDGSHPCSPLSLRVREASSQVDGTMTITRTSSAGGTFVASVPVKAIIEAVNGSGGVVGSTMVSGVLNDASASPWSYTPPATSPTPGNPWFPGVNPSTQQPVRVCRRGNKILPARHCYQPAPKCKATGVGGVGTTAAADDDFTPVDDDAVPVDDPVAVEACTVATGDETVGTLP